MSQTTPQHPQRCEKNHTIVEEVDMYSTASDLDRVEGWINFQIENSRSNFSGKATRKAYRKVLNFIDSLKYNNQRGFQ